MTREITLREYASATGRSFNVLRLMKNLPGFIKRDRRGKIFDLAVLDEYFDQMDALDDEQDDSAFGFERHYRSESEDALRAINRIFLRRVHEEALRAIREQNGRPESGMTGAANLEPTMTTEAKRTLHHRSEDYETT